MRIIDSSITHVTGSRPNALELCIVTVAVLPCLCIGSDPKILNPDQFDISNFRRN